MPSRVGFESALSLIISTYVMLDTSRSAVCFLMQLIKDCSPGKAPQLTQTYVVRHCERGLPAEHGVLTAQLHPA